MTCGWRRNHQRWKRQSRFRQLDVSIALAIFLIFGGNDCDICSGNKQKAIALLMTAMLHLYFFPLRYSISSRHCNIASNVNTWSGCLPCFAWSVVKAKSLSSCSARSSSQLTPPWPLLGQLPWLAKIANQTMGIGCFWDPLSHTMESLRYTKGLPSNLEDTRQRIWTYWHFWFQGWFWDCKCCEVLTS